MDAETEAEAQAEINQNGASANGSASASNGSEDKPTNFSETNKEEDSKKGGLGFFGWYFLILLLALLLIGIILALIWFLCRKKAMEMANGKSADYDESEDDKDIERKSKGLNEIRKTEIKEQEQDHKRQTDTARSRIGSQGSLNNDRSKSTDRKKSSKY